MINLYLCIGFIKKNHHTSGIDTYYIISRIILLWHMNMHNSEHCGFSTYS